MADLVLVVEDDPLIGSSLSRALRATGYEVELATTIADATAVLSQVAASIVVCDLGLPDGDGLDLIEWLQQRQPSVPVIVLTARDDEADVVAGLATGAIDYVTKPFRLAELLARIAAHLRLRATRAGARTTDDVVVGDLTIEPAARRVLVDGREVELRAREFDLLLRLATEAGAVVRRETLMADVWDEHWWGSTKTLDVHIHALRRRLGETSDDGSRITAVRGVGYRLEQG